MIKILLTPRIQKPTECLPACLKMVFDYLGQKLSEEEIIKKVSTDSSKLYDWEFKAGKLACEQGLKASIYSDISYLFDPSWDKLGKDDLIEKLEKELAFSRERQKLIENEPDQKVFIFPNQILAKRYTSEISAAIDFLKVGGEIKFESVSKDMICKLLDKKTPVIVSVNAPLLHKLERAYENDKDDIRGSVWGHVLVVSGYENGKFLITDPDGKFYKGKLEYSIDQDLLIESFLRYNGQMLVVSK